MLIKTDGIRFVSLIITLFGLPIKTSHAIATCEDAFPECHTLPNICQDANGLQICRATCENCPPSNGSTLTTSAQTNAQTTQSTTVAVVAESTPGLNISDQCSTNFCKHGGTCVLLLGDEHCLCPDAFTGSRCENIPPEKCRDQLLHLSCSDIDNVCSTPIGEASCPLYCGLCSPNATEASATTTLAWETEDPRTAPISASTSSATCSFNPCYNGGTCIKLQGDYHCNCATGWMWPVCTIRMTTAPSTTTTLNPTTTPTTRTTTAATTTTTTKTTTTTTKPTTTTTTTTTTTRRPDTVLNTLAKEGCRKSEIVFLVEHVRGDDRDDVDHEADFIRNLVRGWRIDDNHAAIGLLTYDKEVKEHIKLDDYPGDKDAIIDKLENLQHEVGDTGNVYVHEAMHYARDKEYEKHQSGHQKVCVAIVHHMSPTARQRLHAEYQAMKSEGIKFYALGVQLSDVDRAALAQNSDVFIQFPSFHALEDSVTSHANTHTFC